MLLDVHACGICRTDLHVVDGELTDPKLPLVPGHQIVATVIGAARASGSRRGAGRRAVAGLDRRRLQQCRAGRENLCEHARFTGYTLDGGYAERAVADERYCFPLPTRTTTRAPRRSCAPA